MGIPFINEMMAANFAPNQRMSVEEACNLAFKMGEQAHHKDYAALQSLYNTTKGHLDEAQRTVNALAGIPQLQHDLAHRTKQYEEARAQLADAEALRAEADEKRAEAHARLADAEATLKRVARERDELVATIDVHDAENRRMLVQLEEARTRAIAGFGEKVGQIEQAEMQIIERRGEKIEDLQDETARLRREYAASRKANHELGEANATLQKKIADAGTCIEKIGEKLGPPGGLANFSDPENPWEPPQATKSSKGASAAYAAALHNLIQALSELRSQFLA
jgi:DNA repair exonuclease SbcCD ATPase subunit